MTVFSSQMVLPQSFLRSRFSLLLGFSCLFWVLSCGRSAETNLSQGKQLTDQDFPCYDYNPESLRATYQSLPRGFLDTASFQAGRARRVVNHLTGIPSAYLQWLFRVNALNGFHIAEEPQSRGIMGVTYFINDLPTEIQITSLSHAVDFALQHEVGHAIHAKLRREYPGFDRDFARVYQAEAGHSSIRQYARSSLEEYFAESFANHYCSQDSHLFLARTLPETYQTLRRYLEPAPWEPITSPSYR